MFVAIPLSLLGDVLKSDISLQIDGLYLYDLVRSFEMFAGASTFQTWGTALD